MVEIFRIKTSITQKLGRKYSAGVTSLLSSKIVDIFEIRNHTLPDNKKSTRLGY